MSIVRYHRLLERDIGQGVAYYEGRVAGLGQAFLDEVNDAISRAASAPLTGSIVGGTVRRQLVRRFPYSVLYSVEPDGIFVVTVMHQRRNPSSWQRRLRSNP